MPTSWTPERRARQSELIRVWKPWEQSTGPKSVEGKARVARNPWKGGKYQMLREVVRFVRQELKQARELIDG